MTPQWATSSWSPERLARSDWAAVRDQVAVRYASSADATAHRDDLLDLGAGLSVYDNEQWRSEATTGITRFLEPFTIAGYVVMAAAGLSVLNVFVLGLIQRKRERAALRAIGVTPRQEQAVVIAHAALLALLVAVLGGLGGVGLDLSMVAGFTRVLRHQDRLGCAGTATANRSRAVVTVLVLAAAVYPVIHSRRLETVEVLRTS